MRRKIKYLTTNFKRISLKMINIPTDKSMKWDEIKTAKIPVHNIRRFNSYRPINRG